MSDQEYMDTGALKLGYVPEPTSYRDGVQVFDNPNDMYLACTYDMMAHSTVIKRKGRLYMSRKPFAFAVDNTAKSYIIMPGSNYHDRPAWMFWELFDFFVGEEVVGGYSIAWDKHRRTYYPKHNGQSDWAYKKALGKVNEGQVWWAQRSLRQDSASRNCVISPWHAERDLKRYVWNKEEDMQRGSTYQRLPCIIAAQFTQREGTKMLDSFQYQRSMDFTGAVHCDLWRFAEVADWLARTSYPGGYGGGMTIFIATAAIESYGAGAFVKFNKALDWWCNDEYPRLIIDCWPSNKDGWDYTEEAKPARLQYDWFLDQWKHFEMAARHFFYWRFDEGLEELEQVPYVYWRDWGHCLLITAAMLAEERRAKIEAQMPDGKKTNEAYAWIDEHPLPDLLPKVTNYYQYYAAVELVRSYIHRRKFDNIGYVLDYLPTEPVDPWWGVMIDAMLYTSKRQRAKLAEYDEQYREAVEFYDGIFG